MQVAKDEMDFMKDIDKLGFTTEVKLLGLTKAQQKELAAMDVNIRKAFLEELKTGTAWNVAKAKLATAKQGKKGKASILNSFRKSVALNRGFIFDEKTNTIKIGATGKTLTADSKEFFEVEERVLAMLEAYFPDGDPLVDAQSALLGLTGKTLAPQTPDVTATSPLVSSTTNQPIPQAAINDLIKNPSLERQKYFDEEYGAGNAAGILNTSDE